MNALIQHFAFEFRTGIRNKNLLMLNYLFPLGFYLMMGFIMPEINPLFRDTIIPSMVAFAVLAATLLGLPDPLVSAREAGIFRSYKINGIPALAILVIPALTTLLHLVIVAALMVFSAPLLFDAPVAQHWGAFALVFLAFAVASVGIGVLIGVIAPSTRLTVLFSQALFLPSMLLGGMMMPLDMLPEAAGKVARLLPATQAMNAFNGLAMGGTAVFPAWGSVAALFASGLAAFALALFLFQWDSHNAARRRPALLAVLAWIPYLATLFL
ncbi:MAG: ABC transporter permease [Anaerolineales bacterium]|nr:ABC transporter permease [Anaerolineales bacterium]MCA9974976.1 ABC transporter permease [Anaerolineales bacterium]